MIRLRAGATWIRFHSREDRPGLFAGYVGLLSGLGLSIRHASIHTFEETGVYDWFEVKTLKRALAIEKQLLMATASAASKSLPASLKPIEFDAIELVAQGQDEWVVSFKGRDQSGALVAAARALFDEQVSVRWARVHTWGRQIDDIFGVAPCEGGASELVQRLRARLGASGAVKTSAKL